jgi:hypothetical protein
LGSEAIPDSLHAIRRIEPFWVRGWFSFVGDVSSVGVGGRRRGTSMDNSIMSGNQDWLGQYGVTITTSAWSLISFERHLGINLNGGKQYAWSPLQQREKASMFDAPGWGDQLTKIGSWAFHPLAKRSTSRNHIDRIF